jgi:lipid-A-disaccharide synthase-like uncharacterized protein
LLLADAVTTYLLQGVGFAGQALFTARVVTQWWASERARRSVVPASFWWFSVFGTLLLGVYAISTRDPVFIVGPLLNLFLYVRNLMLMRKPGARLGALAWLAPLALAALATGFAVAYLTVNEKGIAIEPSIFWLVIGVGGTALWTLRFPVQWIISERLGRSVLPPAFWWMSLVGSLLLTAYAIYQPDAVFILAYALNPVPCIRNLMLAYRKTDPEKQLATPEPAK